MPYVPQQSREKLDALIEHLATVIADDEKPGGCLNYAICRLAILSQRPSGYTDISNMLGHIRSAEAEIRRRRLDPYEDDCIIKNGDVKELQFR